MNVRWLQGDDGRFYGSVGDGRDDVPTPSATDLPVIPTNPVLPTGLVLSEALLELKRATAQFNKVSVEYERAWTKYVTEEIRRVCPDAVSLWMTALRDDLLTSVVRADGSQLGVLDLPNGEELARLVGSYYDVILPEFGIDLERGVQLRDDSNLAGLDGE